MSFSPLIPAWPAFLPQWNWFTHRRPEERGVTRQLLSDNCAKTWLELYTASNRHDLLIMQFCLGEDDDSDFQLTATLALCNIYSHIKLRRIPLPMRVTHYRGQGNRYWWPRRLETGIFLCGSGKDDVTQHWAFRDSFLKISVFDRENGHFYIQDDADPTAKWHGFSFRFNLWDIVFGRLQYHRDTLAELTKDVRMGDMAFPVSFEVAKYHRSRPRLGKHFTGYGFNVAVPDEIDAKFITNSGETFYSRGGWFGQQLPENPIEFIENDLLQYIKEA